MTTTCIAGMAGSLPEKIITNAELVERYRGCGRESEFESFLKIAGVRERRVLGEGQAASDLGFVAAERLLNDAAVKRDEIDALIYCSLTADYRTPATACVLQHRLGLPKTICAFDLVQTCPAFVHLTAAANGLIVSGAARKVLAILSDSLSQLVHPMDRMLAPVHGDGAVAALFERSESVEPSFEWFAFGSDGAHAERIYVPEGMSRRPATPDSFRETVDSKGVVRTPLNLRADGAAVFHFAVHTIPPFLRNACAQNGVSLDDFDLIVFHQANKMIVETLYNTLKVPPQKRFFYLEKVGNLSGAALPFTLAEALRAGKVGPGSRVLLCGFGAGLNWGAFSLRLGKDAKIAVSQPVVLPSRTK